MNHDEFRSWRRDRYSQSEASKILGISQATISHYENGNWPIPQLIIEKITNINSERNPTVRDLINWTQKNRLSRSEAADYLGISISTLQRLSHADNIDVILTPRMARKMREADLSKPRPEKPPLFKYGRELTEDEKGWALQLCPNRYTGEWTPLRIKSIAQTSSMMWETDAEFVRLSIFRVEPNGALRKEQRQIICIPEWPRNELLRLTHPVVVLNCNSGFPRPKAKGAEHFIMRFIDEWNRVRTMTAELMGETVESYYRRRTPERPTQQATLPPIELPRPATYEEAQRQRRDYIASLRATDKAGRGGIDLNDVTGDPTSDSESTS